jgi:transcription initiation factor IIE alpha subunit
MEPHNLSLTARESVVLESLISGLYAEPGFSDVDAHDLSRQTGIPTKSIRGVLSSLVKKGIVSIETGGNEEYELIYLNDGYHYLHPEWKEYYDAEEYGEIPTAKQVEQ